MSENIKLGQWESEREGVFIHWELLTYPHVAQVNLFVQMSDIHSPPLLLFRQVLGTA